MNAKVIARRAGWSILATVIIVCVGFVIWFKVNETSLIYRTLPDNISQADSLLLKCEKVTIQSEGAVLICWLYPADRPDSEKTWILFFPGNGDYDATDVARCKILHDLGPNILAVRYRGYGSSTGRPSEAGLHADATASYNYLKTVKGAAPANIVVYGHSMGTWIAIDLASRLPVAGVAVEGANESLAVGAATKYPFLPWKLLLHDRYDCMEKIGGIAAPKIFIHATDDQSIPISHGRALFAKATEPKTFLEIHGGHVLAPMVDRERYIAGMTQFLHSLPR